MIKPDKTVNPFIIEPPHDQNPPVVAIETDDCMVSKLLFVNL